MDAHIGYGYFRDELYYIVCGRHLAWGFVDHGPIVALQARLGELLFGDSLSRHPHVLRYRRSRASVFLTGLLAWSLGGLRPAQSLAMICVLIVPSISGPDGFLSMNSFESVFWMRSLALILIQRGWGHGCGRSSASLQGSACSTNRRSSSFSSRLLALLTQQRRMLFNRWAAVGIVFMIVITLPNGFWQIHNHWPTLEFFHNGKVENKNIKLAPLPFLAKQIMNLQPLTFLIWGAGLVWLLRSPQAKPWRWLGLTYLFFLAIMMALHAKDYYVAPIYPVLFAAGGIAWERRVPVKPRVAANRVFAFPILECALILTGLLVLPMSSPMAYRPAAWVRYTTALHLKSSKTKPPPAVKLPQFYADRFGWQQQVAIVARAFNSLSPADQRRVCIFAGNYGEAGAIGLLGRRRGLVHLPPALSGSQQLLALGHAWLRSQPCDRCHR